MPLCSEHSTCDDRFTAEGSVSVKRKQQGRFARHRLEQGKEAEKVVTTPRIEGTNHSRRTLVRYLQVETCNIFLTVSQIEIARPGSCFQGHTSLNRISCAESIHRQPQ